MGEKPFKGGCIKVDIRDMVKETTQFLEKKMDRPDVAIIIGSGLSDLVKKMDIKARIPYNDIPHFPKSTVKGHAGEVLSGNIGANKVMALVADFIIMKGTAWQRSHTQLEWLNYWEPSYSS